MHQKIPKEISAAISGIRVVAMISVVFVHSLGISVSGSSVIEISALSFMKFGTLCFFIVGGVLIEAKNPKYNLYSYTKSRLNSTIFPWLIFLCAMIGSRLILKNSNVGEVIFSSVFESSYWFVLSFIITTLLYLYLEKFNKIFYMFIIFGLLIGTVNIYMNWIPAGHTTAIVPYLAYIYIGGFIFKRKSKIHNFAKGKRLEIIAAWLVFSIANCFEASIMYNYGNDDWSNSLRPLNQVTSILMFLILFSINYKTLPNFIMKNGATFWIYLLHPIVLGVYNLLAERYYFFPINYGPVKAINFLIPFFISIGVYILFDKNDVPSKLPKLIWRILNKIQHLQACMVRKCTTLSVGDVTDQSDCTKPNPKH